MKKRASLKLKEETEHEWLTSGAELEASSLPTAMRKCLAVMNKKEKEKITTPAASKRKRSQDQDEEGGGKKQRSITSFFSPKS